MKQDGESERSNYVYLVRERSILETFRSNTQILTNSSSATDKIDCDCNTSVRNAKLASFIFISLFLWLSRWYYLCAYENDLEIAHKCEGLFSLRFEASFFSFITQDTKWLPNEWPSRPNSYFLMTMTNSHCFWLGWFLLLLIEPEAMPMTIWKFKWSTFCWSHLQSTVQGTRYKVHTYHVLQSIFRNSWICHST